MSSYIAYIRCKGCGKVLSEIKAYHEPVPNVLIPQDIMVTEVRISANYCQDCLNGRSKKQ